MPTDTQERPPVDWKLLVVGLVCYTLIYGGLGLMLWSVTH